MSTSLFLAQAYGLYLVIIGVSIVCRRSALRALVDDFHKNSYLGYFAGAMVTIMGLLLVLSHNIWTGGYVTVVTVLGWLTLFKGMAYLLLPNKVMFKVVNILKSPSGYLGGSVFSIVLGLYLVSKGFGWM